MPRHLRPPRDSQRGAALLVAIVAIAVLTALAVDLAYETQVRLRIAGNARDQLRAEALAQSAVNVSRLVLSFQAQLDQATATASALQSAVTGGTQPVAGGTAGTPGASGTPRIQLWNLIPVSSALTQALFADARGATPAPPPGGGASPVPAASFGDFEGGFQATIDDEGQKINAQLDGQWTAGVLSAQVEALLRLSCESKWDPLFDRTDADGQRYSRTDLLVHLRDWVSDDTTAAALKASFPAGNCSFLVQQNPFEKAFSDKNYPYDRGSDRYKTKNARMDSLDELYQIAGVSDAFMAAFGDQLTVYVPRDGAINVNSTDPATQIRNAKGMVDPAAWSMLEDPKVQENLRKLLAQQTLGGVIGLSVGQFSQTLQAAGLPLRSDLAQGAKAFTDRSAVFRIVAMGMAGDVTHRTEAVVSFDPNLGTPAERTSRAAAAASGQLDLGRLIRWREE